MPNAPLSVLGQDAATDAAQLRSAFPIMQREGYKRAARQMRRAVHALERIVRAEAGCTISWCIVGDNVVYHHTSCRRSWEYRGA